MHLKHTPTDHPVIDVIKNRWSPRSFSGDAISDEELNQLFEAARWAASSMNEQPWRFIYAHRGEVAHQSIVDALMPGNQPWAKEAPVLIVALVSKVFTKNGNPNGTARYDLGQAVAHITLQGTAMGIGFHQMGGIYPKRLEEHFGVEDPFEVVTVVAAGRFGDADQLDEPYLSREKTPRSRKSLDALVGHGTFTELKTA